MILSLAGASFCVSPWAWPCGRPGGRLLRRAEPRPTVVVTMSTVVPEFGQGTLCPNGPHPWMMRRRFAGVPCVSRTEDVAAGPAGTPGCSRAPGGCLFLERRRGKASQGPTSAAPSACSSPGPGLRLSSGALGVRLPRLPQDEPHGASHGRWGCPGSPSLKAVAEERQRPRAGLGPRSPGFPSPRWPRSSVGAVRAYFGGQEEEQAGNRRPRKRRPASLLSDHLMVSTDSPRGMVSCPLQLSPHVAPGLGAHRQERLDTKVDCPPRASSG